jgi:hypothetical protein
MYSTNKRTLSTTDQSHSQFAIQRLIDSHFSHSSLCLLIKFLSAYEQKVAAAEMKLLSNIKVSEGSSQTAEAHNNSACSAKQAATETLSWNARNTAMLKPPSCSRTLLS